MRGRRNLFAVVAVVALALAVLYVAQNISGHISVHRVDETGLLQDSRDAVYYPARAVLDGVNPYDPRPYYLAYPDVGQEFPLYSPAYLLVHLPLALLGLRAAQWTYFAVSVAMAVGIAWVALRMARLPANVAWTCGVATGIILSFPGRWLLYNGQPALVPILGTYLALDAHPRGRWQAPLGVAVALMKPTIGVPLLVLMLLYRRFGDALRGAVIAVASSAVLLPFLIASAGGVGDFVDSLQRDLDATTHSAQSAVDSSLRIDAASVIARTLGITPRDAVVTAFGLVFLAWGGALVWWLARRRIVDPDRELAVTIVCVTIALSTFHAWYDTVIVTAPVLLMMRWSGRRDPWPRGARGVRTAMIVLLLFGLLDPLDTSTGRQIQGGSLGSGTGTALIGWSLMATLALATVVIVLLERAQARRTVPAATNA